VRKANKLYASYVTKRDAGASAKKLGRVLTALDRLFASVGSKAERAAASKKSRAPHHDGVRRAARRSGGARAGRARAPPVSRQGSFDRSAWLMK
jgi:hypothetical protein